MILKPKAGFIKNELNTERLTPLQWDGIMRAMDSYALHFHDVQRKVNGVDKSTEPALHKHIVSNNEVALKAFVEEFVESWEDGNAGDTDLYRKAKRLL